MKRKIIIPVLTACLALSGFTALALNKDNSKQVNAVSADSGYWHELFDVESDKAVSFESNKTVPSYFYDGSQFKNGVKASNDVYYKGDNPFGVEVTFEETTTLTYKTPIYIGDNDEYTPVIEYVVTPTNPLAPSIDGMSLGDIEFGRVEVRLTDVDDPSIYVEFTAKWSPFANTQSYCMMSSNTMRRAGLNTSAAILTSDERTTNGAGQGSSLGSGFSGSTERTAAYYFDYKENQGIILPYSYGGTYHRGDMGLVRDLDNPNHLYYGTDLVFEGFKSEFATLSVRFSEVQATSHIIIKSIDGQDLLTKGGVMEDTAPPVVIANNELLENVPYGEVDTFYPYHNVVSHDFLDGSNITKNVVVKNSSGLVVANGGEGFTPKASGMYNIEYTAVDKTGNESAPLTIPVRVVEEITKPVITFDSKIPFINSANVGDLIEFPTASVTGGSGVYSLTFKLIESASGEVVTDKYQYSVNKVGYYTAIYEYVDYLDKYSKTIKKSIKSELNPAPIFQKINIPFAIIYGEEYMLPIPEARDYASFSGTYTNAEITAEYKYTGELNGQAKTSGWTVVDLTKPFTPPIETGVIELRFKANAVIDKSQVSYSEVYSIDVYKLSPLTDVSEYFILDGVSKDNHFIEADLSEQTVFYPEKENATIKFINPIPLKDANFTFRFDDLTCAYNEIDVEIADSVNYSEKVTLKYVLSNGVVTVYANGRQARIDNAFKADQTSFGVMPSSLNVTLSGNMLQSSGEALFSLLTYDSGEAFNGFNSNKIYLSFTFKGFNGEVEKSAVRFVSFCGQPILEVGGGDVGDPSIVLTKSINGYLKTNSTIVIPSAVVTDLFDPDIKVTVTLKGPNQQIINGINNLDGGVEHIATLVDCGEYNLTYSAIDASGFESMHNVIIYVVDDVDPILEIAGQYKSFAKINSTIDIFSAVATDNMPNEKLDIYVYVFNPNGFIEYVSDGKKNTTYTFTKFGAYRVKYFVRDSYGNYALKEFKITVTK